MAKAAAPPPVPDPIGVQAGVVSITYGMHSHIAISDSVGKRLKTRNVQLVSAVLTIKIAGVVYPPINFSGTVAVASSDQSLGVLRLQCITKTSSIKKYKGRSMQRPLAHSRSRSTTLVLLPQPQRSTL